MTAKKPEPVDMSRGAIIARIDELGQLYKLGMYLVEIGRAAGWNDGVGRSIRAPGRRED